MKKLISTIAITTALLAPGIVLAEGEGGPDVAQQLADVKSKLKTQQQQIEAISEMAASAGGSKVTLGNNLIDNFTFKGDLRARYERRDRDNYGTKVDDAVDRMRTRFRVGGVWKNKTENWEIGAGLATGGNDGTSTNATWSDGNYFNTGDIRLDYAYATHKFGDAFRLTLGQQINPFYSSSILWDGDLRPIGLGGQFNLNGLFVNAGAFDVYQKGDSTYGDDIAYLVAGQVGYGGKSGIMKYKAAAAYYGFDTKVFDTGKSSIATRPNPDYEYKIGALTGEVGGDFGPANLKLAGEFFKNLGADGAVGQGMLGGTLDPKSEDTGWVIGAQGNIKNFKLGYDYVRIGADSVNPYLKDADFGSGLGLGVDIKGHRISTGYNISKNVSIDGTVLIYEPMTRTTAVAGVEEVKLYQLDVNYKF